MEMKMLTGLGGPDYSLSKGDTRDFTDGEALRLEAASFAVPTDPEAFAKLKAKQEKPVEPESDAEKTKKEEEARQAAETNPDADLDAVKMHKEIDEIAAAVPVSFPEDVKTVAAKVQMVRDLREKMREEAAKSAEQE